MCCGGGDFLLSYFLRVAIFSGEFEKFSGGGLKFFWGGLRKFWDGVENFFFEGGVEKFSVRGGEGGVVEKFHGGEILSGRVENFSEGLTFFREEMRFFREGLRLFLQCLRFFRVGWLRYF